MHEVNYRIEKLSTAGKWMFYQEALWSDISLVQHFVKCNLRNLSALRSY